jgi:DNA polymerase-4
MGAEETFEHDLTDRRDMERYLLAQSQRVGQRLCEEAVGGYVVSVKIKYADFTVRSRQLRLPELVCDTTTIYETAKALLDRFDLAGARVRLVGLSVSELCEKSAQPTLFVDAEQERRKRLESVFAKVGEKFGRGSITRATLLDGEDKDE